MKEFIEQDSSWVQLKSVIKLALELGYTFNGRSFTTEIGSKTVFLKFDTMQKIHNQDHYYQNPETGIITNVCRFGENLTRYVIFGSKIVDKSTLQWFKKEKCFKAQKNMVQFC